MSTERKRTTKKSDQSLLVCRKCGCVALTAKATCPWCDSFACTELFDWVPTGDVERQMLTALLMWTRVRTERKYEDGAIGRAAFKRQWKKAWDVLKFWDHAIKQKRRERKGR